MNLNFLKRKTAMNKLEKLAGLIGLEASAITAEMLAEVNAELTAVGITGVNLVSADAENQLATATEALANATTQVEALTAEVATMTEQLTAAQTDLTTANNNLATANAELVKYKPDAAAAAAAAAAANLGENGEDRETAADENKAAKPEDAPSFKSAKEFGINI
jgi:ABC-type transporter Mla subunit MlaD